MSWKRSISLWVGLSLTLSSMAFGDTLVGIGGAYTSRIASIEQDTVSYYPHCNIAGNLETISMDSLRVIGFDDDCEEVRHMPHLGSGFIEPAPPPPPPGKKRVYVIAFKNGQEFHASAIFLKGDIFRATSFKKPGHTIECDEATLRGAVSAIGRKDLLPGEIKVSDFVPQGFKRL